MEAGMISQNMSLICQGLGFGSMICGGFFDDEISKYLEINGVDETVINVIQCGYPKEWNC